MVTAKGKCSVSKQKSFAESSAIMAFLEVVLCYDLNKIHWMFTWALIYLGKPVDS